MGCSSFSIKPIQVPPESGQGVGAPLPFAVLPVTQETVLPNILSVTPLHPSSPRTISKPSPCATSSDSCAPVA